MNKITKVQQENNIASSCLFHTGGIEGVSVSWQIALMQMEYYLPYEELVKAANYLNKIVTTKRIKEQK